MVALFLLIGFISINKSIAQVVINEVVASNGSTVADEDGDFPDWIELYNPTDSTINLFGYGISDDPENLFQFIFPDIEIEPDQYLLVFASSKNRGQLNESPPIYWETVVRQGDNTKYIIPSSPVSTSWITKDFNDSSWDDGTFGIGYGDNDDETVVPNGTGSVFTRTTFTINDVNAIDSLLMHIDFDDGYVAYLNGVEISRFNMGRDQNIPIPYDTFAEEVTGNPLLIFGNELPAIQLKGFEGTLVNGENVLAAQIHNVSNTSSDLTLIPFLSVARSFQPEDSRGVASELNLINTGEGALHLNFKLSSSGETVWLTNPVTSQSEKIIYPKLNQDESFGRGVGSDTSFYIYTLPTPLASNTTQGYERLANPEVSLEGGVYLTTVEVSLSNPELSDITYFTKDGSEPTIKSEKFGTSSRSFSNTTALRLRSIENGKLSSKVVTHTYLIATDHKLPVISISTHPDNLWSDESGIYVRGTNGIDGNGSNGPANWNQDWEIPIHIEYYELDGTLGFSAEAGAKIYGAWSRSINPQKSLAVYFRGEYGTPELDYKLFENKDIDKFQTFILRNSGNDFNNSHMRDALMTTLVKDTEVDYQAFQPTVVYLNGEYFGIHNMREKINEHFLASNSDANSSEVELLGSNNEIIYGSNQNYLDLLSTLNSSNLSNQSEYEEIETLIDMDNYIDYMAAQIYYANTDWPGNNIKFWRDAGSNGKWRWIMYDTDFGFGLAEQSSHNTLNFALEPSGPGWPNPSWATFVFRRLTTSDIFVNKFVNRVADLMNTAFDSEFIHQEVDSIVALLEPEMTAHLDRWQGYGSVENWKSRTSVLKNFGDTRPENMEAYVKERFGVSSLQDIIINTSDKEKGIVKVNRLIPKEYPWVGKYFIGNQIEITAIPKPGYEFLNWVGFRGQNNTDLTIKVNAGDNITANFTPITSAPSPIVINEIMYNSSDEEVTGDWIELYNNTSSTIDLSDWIIKDEDDSHEYIFALGTEIAEDSYLVISSDLDAFNTKYSNVSSLFGNLGFGLSGGSDEVRLYDDLGTLIDSVKYNDDAPWDSTADGLGFSLELKNPELDNTAAENWKSSLNIGGTPGTSNSVLVTPNEITPNLPSTIKLSQNYPNPFNPSTNISFEIPKQTQVNLSIFDMLGRRVAVLTNEVKTAGVYSMTWDASPHSSGVYFYRLEVGSEVFSKKMLLIK